MAACPACTFINADDATACEMCGASLETTLPAAAAVKACAHCTLENAADASACVACGAWWCPRCTRCVPAAVACCDVCGYPESADNDAAAAEAVADAADAAAAAPPAPITPDDVANKDYRPRRVERALAAMPLDALERIVDEPARFVALACGEQPPAARPVGRVADPEPGEPAAGRVADDASEDDVGAESDEEGVAAAEKMLGDASSCPVCGATATTRELLVAHCVARHVWDADEVRRRRAARPPKKKRRRRTSPIKKKRPRAPADDDDDDDDDDDLDDFIVADDEEVEEYGSEEEEEET